MIHLALNGTLVIVTPEKEEFEKWICESKFFGFRCEREKKNERNFHIHKKTPVQWKKKDPQLIFSLRVFSSLAIEFTASVLLSSHFRQHKRRRMEISVKTSTQVCGVTVVIVVAANVGQTTII
jgi:hypothetical protein